MEGFNFSNNSNQIGEISYENVQIPFYMDEEEDEDENGQFSLQTDPLDISPAKKIKLEVKVNPEINMKKEEEEECDNNTKESEDHDKIKIKEENWPDFNEIGKNENSNFEDEFCIDKTADDGENNINIKTENDEDDEDDNNYNFDDDDDGAFIKSSNAKKEKCSIFQKSSLSYRFNLDSDTQNIKNESCVTTSDGKGICNFTELKYDIFAKKARKAPISNTRKTILEIMKETAEIRRKLKEISPELENEDEIPIKTKLKFINELKITLNFQKRKFLVRQKQNANSLEYTSCPICGFLFIKNGYGIAKHISMRHPNYETELEYS